MQEVMITTECAIWQPKVITDSKVAREDRTRKQRTRGGNVRAARTLRGFVLEEAGVSVVVQGALR